MPRNVNILKTKLEIALKAAQLAATAKTFDPNLVNEDDTMSTVIQKVSEATAATFAQTLATPLATIIHEYQTELEFIITGLSAPNGPVSGVLTVKP